MGISPSYAGYTNTGHDILMTLTMPDGNNINFPNIMQFDARQETVDITRVRLDNSVLVADLPRNWSGTITYDRSDSAVDAAIAGIEDAWFSGFDYQLGTLTLHITTHNTSLKSLGFTVEVKFFDVAIRGDDTGTWRGDDPTTCRLGFRAARRAVAAVGAGTITGAPVGAL